MKKNQFFFIILTAILITITLTGCNNIPQAQKNILSESEAITLLKSTYPEYKNYPNDNLPPQSIKTEKDINGWYVAFMQEGSGRPLLGVTCFFVDNEKNIHSIGKYNPIVEKIDFSLKTCK